MLSIQKLYSYVANKENRFCDISHLLQIIWKHF